mmetsp:Transcript_24302/g.35064  ORF Transcript_24302/g.35064 Transcript_24302/m.35064 type:complete len:206 (+) Transcript_24302:413-1030(+)
MQKISHSTQPPATDDDSPHPARPHQQLQTLNSLQDRNRSSFGLSVLSSWFPGNPSKRSAVKPGSPTPAENVLVGLKSSRTRSHNSSTAQTLTRAMSPDGNVTFLRTFKSRRSPAATTSATTLLRLRQARACSTKLRFERGTDVSDPRHSRSTARSSIDALSLKKPTPSAARSHLAQLRSSSSEPASFFLALSAFNASSFLWRLVV